MAWFRWNEVAKLTQPEYWNAFFAGQTYAGKRVTPEDALTLDAVWACTKLISETLGTLPCMVMNVADNSVARGHYLYEFFHDAPNADQTAVEYWENVGLALCLYGNFYAEKFVNPAGRLVAMVPMRPNEVRVQRDGNGRRQYLHYRDANKPPRILPESRVFHVRGMSLGDDTGMSPIEWGKQTFASGMAAEEAAGKLFANGMQASGVLSSDQILSANQREQLRLIMERYAGSTNAGKLMILEAGLKYQALVLDPEKAQMLQTRQFSVEQICRWFGVPAIMIGHASAGQTMWGSGVEQIMLAFSKQAMRSTCKRVEAAIWRDLLTPDERRAIKVEFNMEGLLRGDSAARAEFLAKMTFNGLMTRNEGRAYENRPAMAGGDTLTVPSNLFPIDQLGKAPAAPAAPAQE
jgi:HK97 family phage portal protein